MLLAFRTRPHSCCTRTLTIPYADLPDLSFLYPSFLFAYLILPLPLRYAEWCTARDTPCLKACLNHCCPRGASSSAPVSIPHHTTQRPTHYPGIAPRVAHSLYGFVLSLMVCVTRFMLDVWCFAFPYLFVHACMTYDVSYQFFSRSLQQFDRIRKRNAFVDNYRKEPMFADNLDEFEDSR